MGERIVDDNGVIDFIDDNGETCFIDDAGNFTCDEGGAGGGGGSTIMPTPIIPQSVLRRVSRLRRRRPRI